MSDTYGSRDPLQELLSAVGAGESFPVNSRYHTVARTVGEDARGRPIVYLKRRFLPHPELLGTLGVHQVVDGNRLDNITALRLGDPEIFWRICDANRATKPWLLARRPGEVLRIPLPPGVPGSPGSGG